MTRQDGFSLLELLLVLATSTIFLFAVYQLFFHQQQQYVQQQSLLQLQENNRLALQLLKNNVQAAGEAGCGSLANINLHDPLHYNPRAIYEDNDKIYIEKASYERANLAQNMVYTFDPIYLTQEKLFEEGDVLLISDCTHADLFKVKQVKEGALGQILSHNGLSRIYNTHAQVMRWQIDAFYVKPHHEDASLLALYQKTILPDSSAVELVLAIDSWIKEYAVLQNNTPVFLTAAEVGDWQAVRGVAINHFNIVLHNAEH